ncbi:MAG: hypothetical protein EKK42_20130 [Pseudonocardiaceae bacterium]|nr:MAG: hypothetical protein EKK42_20130 [Pseudonocardiaceae bacterium]
MSSGAELIGHKIVNVELADDSLSFTTDAGHVLRYSVEGDCCSYSYFHDIVGAEKLYENGPVKEVNSIAVDDTDVAADSNEYIKCYGYEIVTEHPKWGDQTTVFSFRNSSNGYYGGWMNFDGIEFANAA